MNVSCIKRALNVQRMEFSLLQGLQWSPLAFVEETQFSLFFRAIAACDALRSADFHSSRVIPVHRERLTSREHVTETRAARTESREPKVNFSLV
ncbi:hypothetical protein HPB50_000560 [Hyalomma asiaticum]|uniref:Uncharacterized protein n=1 Tax=Hyalomma asiaticum TaxID=266040 RepID=A0ACB7T6M0_HYAAI|nr:hypothetical protein HPB50_000560 [Hyalomma asiaticum]